MTIKLSKKEAQYFYVEDSDIHGKGLFASTVIKVGTYLGDYEGPETTDNGMHVFMDRKRRWRLDWSRWKKCLEIFKP